MKNFPRLLFICLLIVASAANFAPMAEAQSRYEESAQPLLVKPGSGSARLIVRRIANLGNRVVVSLWLDGAPFGVIVYGQTYDGVLPTGRHVLSVTVSPRPKWPGIQSEIVLNVRRGQTYVFTAMGDHSGSLILKPAG
ncbi:MAG TPA: hypothetical protein VEI58_03580 [Chthoniobacterales bacterium]|nr:hypothetical protein [Chthoniobacterales bacterium]